MATVQLSADARDDFAKLDGSIRGAAAKKLRLLTEAPEAGKPMTGPLKGHRSLPFSNRGWRIVYELASPELVHVWLIGKRGDDAVYREGVRRLERARIIEPRRRRFRRR